MAMASPFFRDVLASGFNRTNPSPIHRSLMKPDLRHPISRHDGKLAGLEARGRRWRADPLRNRGCTPAPARLKNRRHLKLFAAIVARAKCVLL